jgi:cytochrome c-type biogenesis protein CcmF
MTFVPLMLPMLAALGVGPLLAWKRGDAMAALARLKFAFFLTVVVAIATAYFTHGGPVMSVVGMGLAAWLLGSVAAEFAERVKLFRVAFAESRRRARNMPRATWGMTMAHFGVAVLVAGIAGAAWQTERVETMHPGETIDVAGYQFRFEGASEGQGPNYLAQRGRFTVTRNGDFIATMEPERRFYPVQRTTTTNTAIRTNGVADLYAVIGEPDGKGGWLVRLYHNPLVPWIWFGAFIMALGGVVSLTDRRFRVGAPVRRAAPVAAEGARA